LDAKLDEIQTDFGNRLNLFEARMVASVTSNMSANMQQLIAVVNQLSTSAPPIRDDTNLSITEIPSIPDPTKKRKRELIIRVVTLTRPAGRVCVPHPSGKPRGYF
jgi:hypothetical protein